MIKRGLWITLHHHGVIVTIITLYHYSSQNYPGCLCGVKHPTLTHSRTHSLVVIVAKDIENIII